MERLVTASIEICRQRTQGRLFAPGIYEQLVDINGHAPEPDTELGQESIQPMGALFRIAERIRRSKHTNIGLRSQIFR